MYTIGETLQYGDRSEQAHMMPDYESFVRNLEQTREWGQLEERRMAGYKGRVRGWLLSFVVMFFGIVLPSIGHFLGGLFLVVMSIVMIPLFYHQTHKKYSAFYKKVVVSKLVQDLFVRSRLELPEGVSMMSKCSFHRDKHVSFPGFMQFPLFEKYNRKPSEYDGEDLFVGRLGDTSFQFSDLLIYNIRKLPFDRDNPIYFPVFRGHAFFADFHKHFNGTTILTTRGGKIRRKMGVSGTRIETVSIEFNRMFNITTTDEVTARYLLPANMLERIIALRKLFSKKEIAICLHNGMLGIVIPKADFFEIKGLKRLENAWVLRTYEEIKALVDIVDLLNLNLRIWNASRPKEKLKEKPKEKPKGKRRKA